MPNQRWLSSVGNRKALRGAAAIAALFVFAACGSQGGGDAVNAGPDEALGQVTDLENLVYTESYSGKLVVRFDESLKVRLGDGVTVSSPDVIARSPSTHMRSLRVNSATKQSPAGVIAGEETQSPSVRRTLYSATGEDAAIATIQQVLDAHPAAAITRATDAPEAEVERQRAKLERLSGMEMPDWNSAYRIDVADPDEAVKLMRELATTPGVKYVYPQFRPIPAGLNSTPALTGLQGYLYAENTHGGLNAQAAWAAGAHGKDVYVVDNESGMNFDHEDLQPLIADDWYKGGNFLYKPDCAPGFPPELSDCDMWIAHGTAVTGILIAKDNGHGVTGFVPAANYLHASMAGNVETDLRIVTDGIDDPLSTYDNDIEPGAVWVLEVGLPGKYSNPNCTPPWDASCEYGGVPVELWPDVFDAIKQATAYGVTVIEAGGNGAMDLNNPDLYTGAWSFAHNMATDDAGAIMVGASEGANENKISFSNCGTRVNTFAWGQGVVTTGYPYGPYTWGGINPPIPPNSDPNTYFVDMFGGTSSAAAMVGGAAALVQSYAREQLGHKRYIMPLKMREILVNSGVAQKDSSGCNIGKQPRVDLALSAVSTFLQTVNAQYPKLATDEQFTEAQMLALRQLGVGTICKEFDPANSDPTCPDSEVFPAGTRIANTFDFDGDGRADLVKFENDPSTGSGQGRWYVDLSSKGNGGDNFGAWDIDVAFPPIQGKWVWPYVEDMNSDTRADFVVYDKEHGKFYVALTDTNLIRNGVWHGWDWIIDYSAEWHDDLKLDPNKSNYSRPVLGNFHKHDSSPLGYSVDQWADIALVCSDGRVRIDYGEGTPGSFGQFESTPQLISNDLLAQAPGWAYLPTTGDFNGDGSVYIAFKVPDTLPDAGRMYLFPFEGDQYRTDIDWMESSPKMFGGNDLVSMAGIFQPLTYPVFAIKAQDGKWRLTNEAYTQLLDLPPSDIYGDNSCHPVTTDFDGDGIQDRAVMCPGEWRIAYSGTKFESQEDAQGVRHISLGYDPNSFSLPGRAYSGGVSYAYTKQLIELYQQMHPGVPPPILVDMVTVSGSP